MSDKDMVALHDGSILYDVHPQSACEGRPCCIHNPSNHPLSSAPLHWRAGRYLMERRCEHGIGHPDPDHMAYVLSFPGPVGEEASGVHGCDGCCSEKRRAA